MESLELLTPEQQAKPLPAHDHCLQTAESDSRKKDPFRGFDRPYVRPSYLHAAVSRTFPASSLEENRVPSNATFCHEGSVHSMLLDCVSAVDYFSFWSLSSWVASVVCQDEAFLDDELQGQNRRVPKYCRKIAETGTLIGCGS